MRIQIPFLGPDYANRSSNVNAQKSVNLYPRMQKPGSKTAMAMYGTPGLRRLGVAGTGPWRSNLVEFGGELYGVSGAALYKINANFSPTFVGNLSTAGGRCELVAGRNYLLVVDGTSGYTYDGTTYAEITDPDFTQTSSGDPASPTHCTYIGGYFVVNKGGSDEFAISAIEDPTDWDTLDFATAEAAPDNVLALVATYNSLYLVGTSTTQVFYQSGNPSFPFDPYPQGTMEVGIQAPHSLAKSSAGLFWLATTSEGDIAVVRVSGFQSQIISEDIAWDLQQMSVTDDATGFVYRLEGRAIYQITFPTENKTFEYIVDDGIWVERSTYSHGRYIASGHGYISNTHVMVNYESGDYYALDYDVYSDNGDPIERVRRSQHHHSGNNNAVICHELIVEFEAGVGLVTGQGEDPQAMLRYSDDGGHTWSSELWRSIGKIGNYKHRARWAKLGKFRNRIWELKVSDPVKVVITDAYANVTPCSH